MKHSTEKIYFTQVKGSKSLTLEELKALDSRAILHNKEALSTVLDNILIDISSIYDRVIPSGGTVGQSLTKRTDFDFDTEWKTVGGGSGGISDVKVNGNSVVTNDIANIDLTSYAKTIDIPSKTSDLVNDNNYQTSTQVGVSINSAISTHNTSVNSHADIRDILNSRVGLPTYDTNKYELTFVTSSGASVVIDLPIEQIGLTYDSETKEMVFTNAAGIQQRIPLADFIDIYIGSIGNEIQVVVDTGNIIKATLLNNSISLDKLELSLQELINSKASNESLNTLENTVTNLSSSIDAINAAITIERL